MLVDFAKMLQLLIFLKVSRALESNVHSGIESTL